MNTKSEYPLYGLILEAILLHKVPQTRFTIFPQLYLHWHEGATSRAGDIPDFGIGRYAEGTPHIKLYGGIEIKSGTPGMELLPPPDQVLTQFGVREKLYFLLSQAEDQAKAAVKQNMLPKFHQSHWLLFVGPYFASVSFGPFDEDELITRATVENDSGDYGVFVRMMKRREVQVDTISLFRIGTDEAVETIEEFLSDTHM
ncbi:hypothetical protein BDQ17DRAFT_1498769 [Cyathus striatus]|nr:hypothetical protein BDQ17DRAFT_1498769 [Cyathus striatus]